MGSSKKHKKESKKKKHRSRSRSSERTEKHRHHKRHHKDRKKEKQLKTSEVSDSEDDCILIPSPPKISLVSSPPSDDDSEPSPPPPTPPPPPPPPVSTRKKSPSPPPSASNDSSLSISETNRLRAKLGLKPLEVSTPVPVSQNDESAKPVSELMGGTDMGEFVHKPADNIAKKVKMEKLKAKLAEKKEKRKHESRLARIKKLGEDSDEDDVSKWVLKSRKLQEEREKAEKKAKELDDMDAVFGIGELVEEDLRNEKKTLYTNKDLKGLRVEHDMNNFAEGKQVILTLKDKGVLEEGDDTLVNVNMIDDEHYKKNISNRKQNQFGYNALDDEEMEEDDAGNRILKKYNEEIDGVKKSSFTIGIDETKRKEMVKKKLQLNKRVESLNMPAPQLAAEYYTEEEMSIKFKKPKKKIRKIRDRKPRVLKADDLLAETSNGERFVKTEEEEWLKDIGSRRRPTGCLKPDSDDLVAPPPPIISIKQEPEDVDIRMEVDDLPPPPEDISEIKVENDDTELELALKKARRLKQKEVIEIKPRVETVAEIVLSEEMGYAAPGPGGSIVLNSTAEFCRTLGDIPTYGLSGNRDEDAQEILDFEREMKEVKQKKEESKTINRGGWNDVEMDDKAVDIIPYEAPILDAEPDLGTGVAGALRLAVSKGYLEKETTKRPSASRFAHLQAQNYSIEDKAHVEDEKFGRRERYMGPTCDFKEKDNYKPNVKLDYIDDDGHVLCAKEAFRYLSHKFHGKGPGKNKVEKRMKKNEQEVLMKQMSSTDTPLGTLSMLQQKQKETQSAYIVLSGSKHVQTPASISKTKL